MTPRGLPALWGPWRVRPPLPAPSLATRLPAALVGSLLLTTLPDVTALLLAVLLLGAAGLPACCRDAALRRQWLRRLVALNAFMALVWLSLVWQPGGWSQALLISLRAHAVLLGAGLLLGRCDEAALARAWVQCGLGRQLGLLMLLMLRASWLLRASWQRVERASRARAFEPRLGRRVWQVRALQLAWWLDDAVQRATALQAALAARCFGTRLNSLRDVRVAGQHLADAGLWLLWLGFLGGLWGLALW